MKYEQEIREILKKTVPLAQSIGTISPNIDLQTVGIDSLKFISLVVEIENRFGFEFPDEKLIMSESCSIEKLCDIISRCLDTHK